VQTATACAPLAAVPAVWRRAPDRTPVLGV